MSQMLVGIDVSMRSHHVQFMHGEGHSLADFSVSNDIEGANTLIQKLLKTAEKNQLTQLKIWMESTDQYSWHLAHYLKNQLQGYAPLFQTAVFMLNARKVARFKKGYDTLPKNDELMPG
ncbi:transposase [Bacillus sp. RS11]